MSAKARLLEALASRQRDDDLIEQLAAEVQVGEGGAGAGGSMLGLVWQRFEALHVLNTTVMQCSCTFACSDF